MNRSSVLALVRDRLLPAFATERSRLDAIDLWYRWDQPTPIAPPKASPELKRLLDLSRTPWLARVVANVTQMMYVDAYRSPETAAAEPGAKLPPGPWDTWTRNNMNARQIPLHRAAVAFGYAYQTILPGTVGGKPSAVMRGVSPRNMLALYAEPENDDWPMFAVKVIPQTGGSTLYRLLDEDQVYYLGSENNGNLEFIEARAHGLGFCPVVRFANLMDLEGRLPGEVEPFISVASRIDKTTYDRLLAQHFNSWRVLTATGLEPIPNDDDGTLAKKRQLLLRQQDILTGEAGVEFGAIPGTDMTGYTSAHDSDIETLAAVSQTPSHNLTGKMINLSAEALAAAESMAQRKIIGTRTSFGGSHDQALRTTALIEGNTEGAQDYLAHVTWQDLESRSLSQVADALGKLATQLGIPAQALWGRIPGVTATDVLEWQEMARNSDTMGQLSALLAAQAAPVPPSPVTAPVPAAGPPRMPVVPPHMPVGA